MRSIRERFIERFILAAPADGVALFGWCVIVLVLLTAVACNPRDDDDPLLAPTAPSPVAAAADSATSANAAEPWTLAGGGPRTMAVNAAGTCVPGAGFVRCWHFYPTMVLWVSPNSTWARNGIPFVRYLRSGFKVYCDKTIVWAGGRKIYRVSPMRPVIDRDGERRHMHHDAVVNADTHRATCSPRLAIVAVAAGACALAMTRHRSVRPARGPRHRRPLAAGACGRSRLHHRMSPSPRRRPPPRSARPPRRR